MRYPHKVSVWRPRLEVMPRITEDTKVGETLALVAPYQATEIDSPYTALDFNILWGYRFLVLMPVSAQELFDTAGRVGPLIYFLNPPDEGPNPFLPGLARKIERIDNTSLPTQITTLAEAEGGVVITQLNSYTNYGQHIEVIFTFLTQGDQ